MASGKWDAEYLLHFGDTMQNKQLCTQHLSIMAAQVETQLTQFACATNEQLNDRYDAATMYSLLIAPYPYTSL